jgi:hypothetical protein
VVGGKGFDHFHRPSEGKSPEMSNRQTSMNRQSSTAKVHLEQREHQAMAVPDVKCRHMRTNRLDVLTDIEPF